MFKIVSKEHFSEKVVKLVVEAPMIAHSRRPGHFVIVRACEGGERIPLTIADADTKAGAITLVVQEVGVSTKNLRSQSRRRIDRCCRPPRPSHPYQQCRHCSVLWRRCGRSTSSAHNQSHEASRQPGDYRIGRAY